MNEYIKKDDKVTYDHSRCLHCGNETKRSYNLIEEIKNILNSHPVPLSAKEIQNYLGNANYDKLDQYIKIEQDHLEKILKELTEVEIIRSVFEEHTYYVTRTQINKVKKL